MLWQSSHPSSCFNPSNAPPSWSPQQSSSIPPLKEELNPSQVFKAQRIFKRYCNEAGNITKKRWRDITEAVPAPSYKEWFGDYCWLTKFLGKCRSGMFRLDLAWDRLRVEPKGNDGVDLEPRNIDEIVQAMDKAFTACEGLSIAKVLAMLEEEVGEINIATLKLRLSILLLGQNLSVCANVVSQDRVRDARHHLEFVLSRNPASSEAHKWLSFALFQQKDLEGALLSARRSLLLNGEQAGVWDFAGCLAYMAGNMFHAIYLLKRAAALGSFAGAMHYGEMLLPVNGKGAAEGFRLAMDLAQKPSDTEVASNWMSRVPAEHREDCTRLQVADYMPPEVDVGKDYGNRLLF